MYRAPDLRGRAGGAARSVGTDHLGVHIRSSNRNMLCEAYEWEANPESKYENKGYLLAGNAGKLGGGLRQNFNEPVWDVGKPRDLPQEEGSLLNFF